MEMGGDEDRMEEEGGNKAAEFRYDKHGAIKEVTHLKRMACKISPL